MSTVASPVAGLPVPLASLATTLRLQLARLAIAGFGTAPLAPPPIYRQEEPRSAIFAVQAVSESISPEKGAVGPGERDVPPQDDVPGAVVYLSDRAPRVVVVVLDVDVVVGAALLVVVVGAALLAVVVGAALVAVVVGAALLAVVVGAALLVVVVGAALLVVVVGAALLVVVVGAALLVVVVGAALLVVVVGASLLVVVV